jgi:hypothetical protein
MVKGDSPIKSPADLAGRPSRPNTLKNIVDTSVRASVRKAGGDPKAVKFVELPFRSSRSGRCSPARSTRCSWSSRSNRRCSRRGGRKIAFVLWWTVAANWSWRCTSRPSS